MTDILGLDATTVLLIAAGLLFALWWVARSPKLKPASQCAYKVFCLRCNWEGRVVRSAAACGGCGSRNLSVLTV